MPLTLGLAVASMAAPAVGQPPPDKAACAAAFEDVQVRRRDGRLKAARHAAITCSHEACQAAIRGECVTWLDDLRRLVPSIVVAVRDASGADVPDARVLVDGELVSTRLDGRPIDLDPGTHDLRVEPASREPLARQVVLAEGEMGRLVTFETATPSGVKSALVPAGFSVAGAGLLVGAITGGLAFSGAAYCRDNGCTEAELEERTAIAHASTASFAIGAAGLALGVVGLFVPSEENHAAWPTERAVSKVRVEPLVAPGFVGLRGEF